MSTNVKDIVHPAYTALRQSWSKFRLTFAGGSLFVEEYLQKFSEREDSKDFDIRRSITPPSSHSKAALMDINNAIFTRMIDVKRVGGPKSYQDAVQGMSGGVDLEGASMNTFLGVKIMPWLLAMGKVGVFIDKEQSVRGETLKDTSTRRPYLYVYQAEDIRSWAFDKQNRLTSVLLRDHNFVEDGDYALPTGRTTSYRLLQLTKVGVRVTFFNVDGAFEREILLNLPLIPFTIVELSQSLLTDIADLQIALMNLSSSDINYALKSNFPFYTEQYEPRTAMPYTRQAQALPQNNIQYDENGQVISNDGSAPPAITQGGTAASALVANQRNADAGVTQGRAYAKGLEAPQFINPSSEPLKVSMEKQQQMKADILLLVNLSLTTLRPGRASADSKSIDKEGLESGLARIAAVLENSERQIAVVWSSYEISDDVATITYPEDYTIQTRGQRLAEAGELQKIGAGVPSFTYQKAVKKRVAELTVKQSTTNEELDQIYDEIDSATVVDTDPDNLYQDVENGLATTGFVSELRGYPEDQAGKAQIERAERLAITALAQSQAGAEGASKVSRGTDPDNPTDESGKIEKEIAGEDND